MAAIEFAVIKAASQLTANICRQLPRPVAGRRQTELPSSLPWQCFDISVRQGAKNLGKRSSKCCFILAAALVALGGCHAGDQDKTAAQMTAQPQPPQPDYHPSLADIMTMAVQPRHIKLGIAGKIRNWPYLAYETGELRSAFTRVAKTVPTFRGQDMAALIASGIKDPIDAMADAVAARDGQKFDAAYDRTTAACNACHTNLGKAFVVIRVPAATFYPDQEFSTQTGSAKQS